MTPEQDALALRCAALEQRMRWEEQSTLRLYLYGWALVGLVLAAIVVGAVELRAIYRISEAHQCQQR